MRFQLGAIPGSPDFVSGTPLQGSFDVRFRWDPAGADAIVHEAAKQLGLLLTPAKRRIEVTVVEAVEARK